MVFSGIRSVSRTFATVAGVVFIAISILVVVDVIARTAGQSIGGITEVSENLLVLAIAIALAETQRSGGHVSVELVVTLMTPEWQRIARIANRLLSAALVGTLTYGLLNAAYSSYAMGEYQFSTLGSLPIWPTKAALAIGFVLLALELLIEIALECGAVADREAAKHGEVGTGV